MKSKSIGTIRRSELSRATFEAVVRYGLRGTTLEKVGEIAGVSKGVVLHHFKGKSALLEAVFRRSNNLLSDSAIELFRYADTPYERLWAIIIANFNDAIPAGTTYTPNSLTLNGGALTDAVDADAGELDTSVVPTVVVRLGDLTQVDGVQTVFFEVTID